MWVCRKCIHMWDCHANVFQEALICRPYIKKIIDNSYICKITLVCLITLYLIYHQRHIIIQPSYDAYQNPGRIGVTLYTATLEGNPELGRISRTDQPLHSATQPNINTPDKLLNHTTNLYYANTVVTPTFW